MMLPKINFSETEFFVFDLHIYIGCKYCRENEFIMKLARRKCNKKRGCAYKSNSGFLQNRERVDQTSKKQKVENISCLNVLIKDLSNDLT